LPVSATPAVTVETPAGTPSPTATPEPAGATEPTTTTVQPAAAITFSRPPTLTVYYRETDLQEGRQPGAPRIFRYDEKNETWQPLPTEVDEKAGTLTARLEQFGVYGAGSPSWIYLPVILKSPGDEQPPAALPRPVRRSPNPARGRR
jgi:hypothetical protein